jgi:hypothetical protein
LKPELYGTVWLSQCVQSNPLEGNNAMTIKEVKALAKQYGIKAQWDSEWKEWNIEGYYTDCNEDAAQTIETMANAGYGCE